MKTKLEAIKKLGEILNDVKKNEDAALTAVRNPLIRAAQCFERQEWRAASVYIAITVSTMHQQAERLDAEAWARFQCSIDTLVKLIQTVVRLDG